MSRKRKVVARPTGRRVEIQAVEPRGDVIVYEDGRIREDTPIGVSEETLGRMKAGYICAHCYEDLDTPFPDRCPVCGFEMARKQAEYIANRYIGTTWVGPTTSIEDEKALMMEMRERALRNRNDDILIAKPQIIVPKGFS